MNVSSSMPRVPTCAATAQMQSGPLFTLASHVCAAATPGGVVLLDLRRNRYFGLACSDADAVAEIIADWPASRGRRPAADPRPRVDSLRSLERAGLLTLNPGPRLIPATPAREASVLASVGEELESAASPRPVHAIRLLHACTRVSWMLRTRSLLDIVADLQRRRRTHATDELHVIELTGVFRRLRPFAFSAKDQCLFHALALRYFLLAQGVETVWMIGVRTQPWFAHSWVQYGRLVLDSSPEKVCDYATILAA